MRFTNFIMAFFSFFMLALSNQRGEIDPATGKEKVIEPELDADGKPIVPGAELDKDGKPIVKKPGAFDVSALPQEAQDLIAKLRKENADSRTKNKATSDRLGKIEKALKLASGDEEDDESPELKLSKVTSRNEELEVRSAYQEMAIEHSIPKEKFKYFSYLMNEQVAELEEGEEMTEEQFEAVLEQVQAAPSSAEKASNTTSVNAGKGGKPPKKTDEVTAEQFKKMGITEKSKLYQTNKDLYNSLLAQVGV